MKRLALWLIALSALPMAVSAEAVGDEVKAKNYYEALLKSTDNGAHSARPEFDHVKAFISSTALALQ
jgi:hypothetical protein